MKNNIEIDIQYFQGCPNANEMIKRVKEAILQSKQSIKLNEILVEDDVTAIRTEFRGSPTLLINKQDFENMPAPVKPSLSCRYYKNGLPTAADIINWIDQHSDLEIDSK